MKFIHTADWHIGKIVNEFSMIEDQRFILNELIKLIEDEKPDALLIAGDLYDRSVPPAEAVDLLDGVLSTIINKLKVPIIAVAGNHDSPERLSFVSSLLKISGLNIQGLLKKDVAKVVLEDKHGKVNFYMVPYADPAYIRELYEDSSIRSHEEGAKRVLDNIYSQMNEEERNVLVTHGYITNMKDLEASINEEGEEERAGLITSSSERPLSIGGTDLISVELVSRFNYVALGHLHRAQRVKNDNIRYSGSLLKYSTSEVNQKKSVTIVDMKANGEVDIRLKTLSTLRDLRTIKGPLKELISKEVYDGTNTEDYVFAVLTDEGELMDPISKLRAVYPNIMGLNRESTRTGENNRTSASEGYKSKSKEELFGEFYKNITGKDLDSDSEEILREIIEEVQKGEV